jgi:hypothetical protein
MSLVLPHQLHRKLRRPSVYMPQLDGKRFMGFEQIVLQNQIAFGWVAPSTANKIATRDA